MNCETSDLDSDNDQSGFGKDQLDTTNPYQVNRHKKGASTCSDSDVFLKDSSQVNTPSEAASMSGNELSGEIYASPTAANAEYSNANKTDMIQVSNILQASSSSSLLMTSVLHENMSQVLENSNSNSPDASGLLVIDSAAGKNVDERSASFIDNRFSASNCNKNKVALSRSSTLTPGMTFEGLANTGVGSDSVGHAVMTRQATIDGKWYIIYKLIFCPLNN